jgi:surface polysaccharide O-acyltransferase-like enzyme
VTQTLAHVPAQHRSLPTVPGRTDAKPPRAWALDALRLLAISGVVMIHIIGMLVENEDWQGTLRWWAAVTVDLGLTWVVPVFVMISGALVLAPRAHASGPAAFYRRRCTRILPALVVWHVVYLVGVRLWLRGEDLGLTQVTVGLINAKVYTALYFLWLIAGLYVIAPVLAAFLRDGGPRRALITAGVALGWTQLAYLLSGVSGLLGAARPLHLNAVTQWWPYVGLFLAGWALHRVVLSRRATVAAGLVAVAAMAEVIWQFGQPAGRATLHELLPVNRLGPVVAVGAIGVFLVAVSAGARVTPGPRVARTLQRLSDASFGVFLVHLLIFQIIRRMVPAVAEASSLGVLLATYAVVLVLSFAVSAGAARIPYVRAVF